MRVIVQVGRILKINKSAGLNKAMQAGMLENLSHILINYDFCLQISKFN